MAVIAATWCLLVPVSMSGCAPSDGASTAAASAPASAPTTTASTEPTALTASQRAAQKARAAKAPRQITVSCRNAGVEVSSATVTASQAGVVVVAQRAAAPATSLKYLAIPGATPEQQFAGTIDFDAPRSTFALPVPPGTMTLTCLAGDKRVGASRTVTVYDRGGFYREVDIEGVLNCRPDQAVEGPSTPPRATSAEALDTLMDTIRGPGTFTYTPGPGYPGSTAQAALVKNDGQGFGTAVSQLQGNGAFIARLTSIC